MGDNELPGWITAAIPAAVRLAAEAGTEVDDVLQHAGTDEAAFERMDRQASRLQQSAELTEVATDLAGLLWAECEDVPLIATILEEPAAHAALEAVAEARRRAAGRLAAASPARQSATPPTMTARFMEAPPRSPTAEPFSPAPPAATAPPTIASPTVTAAAAVDAPSCLDATIVPADPQADEDDRDHAEPAVMSSNGTLAPDLGGDAHLLVPSPSIRAAVPAMAPVKPIAATRQMSRQAAGAVVAGAAAAALLLFGRHLRRT